MYNIILSLTSFLLSSFYSLQFSNTDGTTINMSSYEHKKILLVNIATGSPRAGQLAGLQQLQQTYGDSLVIIAFPSNSFSNEPRTNAEIKQFCQQNYNATFVIAEKNAVAGTGIQPVYYWLSHMSENGARDGEVVRDFQKFLIDKEGELIGIFAPSVSPMDPVLTNAITSNY